MRTCKTCVYYKDASGPASKNQGQCRIDPPKAGENWAAYAVFPVVKDDWWCGRHTLAGDYPSYIFGKE